MLAYYIVSLVSVSLLEHGPLLVDEAAQLCLTHELARYGGFLNLKHFDHFVEVRNLRLHIGPLDFGLSVPDLFLVQRIRHFAQLIHV